MSSTKTQAIVERLRGPDAVTLAYAIDAENNESCFPPDPQVSGMCRSAIRLATLYNESQVGPPIEELTVNISPSPPEDEENEEAPKASLPSWSLIGQLWSTVGVVLSVDRGDEFRKSLKRHTRRIRKKLDPRPASNSST